MKEYKVEYSIKIDYVTFVDAISIEEAELKVSEWIGTCMLGDIVNIENPADYWDEYSVTAYEEEY